jgi:hypothetical protein
VRDDVLVAELLQLVDAISLVAGSGPGATDRAGRLLALALSGVR